jgi:dUTP pyrophosphatase
MLNGKELIDRGVIKGALEENVTQHGYDLRLKRVFKSRDMGYIPSGHKKTILPLYDEIECKVCSGDTKIWSLDRGYYMVDFIEGCDIPSTLMGLIVQRSSLARCGAWIHSSIFDAGFKTDCIGTFMEVFEPIRIEYEARVAQFIGYDCTEVLTLYNGQFQNDQQRIY